MTPTFSSLGIPLGLAFGEGHEWILYENLGPWQPVILSIFLSSYRLEKERVDSLFGRRWTWPSSLTDKAIDWKTRGSGSDSWLGCGDNFFPSQVVVLFLLSLSKYLFRTHHERSQKMFSPPLRATRLWEITLGWAHVRISGFSIKALVIGILSFFLSLFHSSAREGQSG